MDAEQDANAGWKQRLEDVPLVAVILVVGALATAVLAVLSLLSFRGPGIQVSSLALGEAELPGLQATFTAGSHGETITRLTVVEYYLAGEITPGAWVPDGCGGRDAFVLTLAHSTLVDRGSGSTFSIQQHSADGFSSPVAGYYDSLPECYDKIQIEARPNLHVEAGSTETMRLLFDESLVFDTSHAFPLEGESSSEDIHAEFSMYSEEHPYFDAYGLHVAAVAAHTASGRCSTSVLDLKPAIPTPADVEAVFEPGETVRDWLCSMPERPDLLS